MKKKSEKRRIGRPSTGGTKPKRYFRTTDEQWQMIVDAATAQGRTAAAWMRDLLLTAAAKILDVDQPTDQIANRRPNRSTGDK